MSDKTPKSSREAVRPDMRVLNQQLTLALFFRPWNPAASDKSPSSSNPATSSGPTLFSKPPPPALLKPDSAASTGAGGVFGMPPPSRPPAEGAALFSKPASAQSQGGSGLFGKNLSSSGTGTSGLALFAGQSSVKRSAGTRPNTPVFDEQEEGEIGDDREGDYLPGGQDNIYEEDDAGQSGSQPDVTFVPSQDSIVPFGITEPSSQALFGKSITGPAPAKSSVFSRIGQSTESKTVPEAGSGLFGKRPLETDQETSVRPKIKRGGATERFLEAAAGVPNPGLKKKVRRSVSKEELATITSVRCEQVPTEVNKAAIMIEHFSQFGEVVKVVPNVKKSHSASSNNSSISSISVSQCTDIGMRPENVKHEVKASSNLTFGKQVLRIFEETLAPLPKIYRARQHLENPSYFVARAWPVTADLGPLNSPDPGPSNSVRFVKSLPGWEDLSGHDLHLASHIGTLQVMLVRLLSRWRPEVRAFLFPCGQFVYPGQMRGSLPEKAVQSLTILAHQFTSLTQLELSLISALLATNPLSPCGLYKATHAAIFKETRSGLNLVALAMEVLELFLMASTKQWQNVSIIS